MRSLLLYRIWKWDSIQSNLNLRRAIADSQAAGCTRSPHLHRAPGHSACLWNHEDVEHLQGGAVLFAACGANAAVYTALDLSPARWAVRSVNIYTSSGPHFRAFQMGSAQSNWSPVDKGFLSFLPFKSLFQGLGNPSQNLKRMREMCGSTYKDLFWESQGYGQNTPDKDNSYLPWRTGSSR